MLRKILKEEHAGFSGITHWLIAIMFFFLMWFIPLNISQNYIAAINENILFFIIIFFIIGGASLLPDLDSCPLQEGGSTAVYQLGILGYSLSILAITISGITYTIFHTKYDQKPKSQHRMLFHTPLIPILIFIYTYFFLEIPEGLNIIENIQKVGFADSNNYSILILIFFAGISVYLGASMLIYKILKLFKKQKYTQFLCLALMTISIIYMLFMKCESLKLIGIAISLGYLFHIIADFFSKGSAPLFFPIPVPYKLSKLTKVQFWKKPAFPLALTTGGIGNIILNFIVTGVDIFLAWLLFFK